MSYNPAKDDEYIRGVLTDRELLEQLAEECAELGQAALKYIRALGISNNPTPIPEEEAEDNLYQEAMDVLLCLHMIYPDDSDFKSEYYKGKIQRWATRIRAAQGNKNN